MKHSQMSHVCDRSSYHIVLIPKPFKVTLILFSLFFAKIKVLSPVTHHVYTLSIQDVAKQMIWPFSRQKKEKLDHQYPPFWVCYFLSCAHVVYFFRHCFTRLNDHSINTGLWQQFNMFNQPKSRRHNVKSTGDVSSVTITEGRLKLAP